MSLLSSILKRNIRWTSLSTLSRLVVEVARMFILMRILDPKPFGVFAIALLAIRFGEVIINLGLDQAMIWKETIKKTELAEIQRRQFIVSVLLTILLTASATFIADIYSMKSLNIIIPLMSLGLLFQGFTMIHQMLQVRFLNYNTISQVTIFSSIFSFTLTIVLAIYGYGVWALVWGSLLHTISAALYYLIKSPIQLNLLFTKKSKIKSYVSYGKWILVNNILVFFSKDLDVLISGLFFPSNTLGLYRNGKVFAQKPLYLIKGVINKLSFPTLSQMSKIEKQKSLTLFFLQSSGLLLFYGYTLLFLLGEWLILSFFKPSWQDMLPFLYFFIVIFTVRRLSVPFSPLLLSRGNSKLAFKLSLFQTISIAIIFSGLIYFKLTQILASWIVLELVFYFLRYVYIAQPLLNLSLSRYFKETCRILVPIASIIVGYNSIGYSTESTTSIIFHIFVITSIYWVLAFIFNKPLIEKIYKNF